MREEEEEKKEDLSQHEIESFVRSRVWRALVSLAVEQTGNRSEENNVLDPLIQPSRISKNQGFIEGIGWCIDQPAILLESVEYERKKEEMREEKEDG